MADGENLQRGCGRRTLESSPRALRAWRHHPHDSSQVDQISCPGAFSRSLVDNDQGVSSSGRTRSAANWRMASLGYLRCLPSVRVKGSFPSRAHRVTVFGDT